MPDKDICVHCGSRIGEREVTIYKGLLSTLYRVYKWCIKNNTCLIKRKELKNGLLTSENDTARFGDLKHFGDLISSPNKGSYRLNMRSCREFFQGTHCIPKKIWKDLVTGNVRVDIQDMATKDEFPNLIDLITEDGNYIVNYKNETDDNGQLPLF